MLSDIRRRKFTSIFRALDTDGDGFLEAGDFQATADGLAQQRGWQRGTPEYDIALGSTMSQWESVRASADADNDGRVTLDEYLEFIANLLASPDAFHRFAVAANDQMILAVDVDGDGHLNHAEYRALMDSWRIPAEKGDAVFRHLDANGDGLLSRDELMAFTRDFYYSDDTSSVLDLWGTLE